MGVTYLIHMRHFTGTVLVLPRPKTLALLEGDGRGVLRIEVTAQDLRVYRYARADITEGSYVEYFAQDAGVLVYACAVNLTACDVPFLLEFIGAAGVFTSCEGELAEPYLIPEVVREELRLAEVSVAQLRDNGTAEDLLIVESIESNLPALRLYTEAC